MILRSGRRIGYDNLPIDFDDASNEWMANKKKLASGVFEYLNKLTTFLLL
uniref:Uncharacterized protein n=1 Tax=viral metagenome TaxID=1070528 RepID=A0A6C0L1M1_9ZZZZ